MPMRGSELRQHRRRLGLTQKAMAERLGLHWNSVARMERDEMTISEPVARLVRLLARLAPRRRRPPRRPGRT
jgi:DNA-binding XRE family transcriptional regulator